MKKTLALMLLLAGLTMEVRAETLYWTGAESNVWDYETANWIDEAGKAACFSNGDDVVFGEAGHGKVSLAGELAPAGVLVDTRNTYTFSGDGKLTGTMQLTKRGDGVLFMATANNYTGGTRIKGGTVSADTDNALGAGAITIGGDTGRLYLGGNAISNSVTLESAAASFGGGTFNGHLAVGANQHLSLIGSIDGSGTITLAENARLNLGIDLSISVIMEGNAIIGNVTLNVNLPTGSGNKLTLCGDIAGTGNIILGSGAELDLSENTCFNPVVLEGSAVIGNGTLNGNLTGLALFLSGNLQGAGSIILRDSGMLDLSHFTLSNPVVLEGSAYIGNGTLNSNLSVGAGKKLVVLFGLSGTGSIALGEDSTLDLAHSTLFNHVILQGNATITDGTVAAALTAGHGGSVQISNATITAGTTTVKQLKEDKVGLLRGLSVSDGLIAGTDRQSSLADGLNITSESDLLIKSMTLTANNKISVGSHTITLQDVTIKLSQTDYELVEDGVYLFDLADLFHCSVDMTDVTFDASELTLPEGFNPASDSISFNLGDAKLTDATASQNITLLMGGFGSQTMSIDAQGNPVFTALVKTPEPTTCTLSLLALCALTARRRKR